MTNVADEASQVLQTVAPESPLTDVVSDIVKTAENPSVTNIIDDVELAVGLIKQLKASLAGQHPTVVKIVKTLLKGL